MSADPPAPPEIGLQMDADADAGVAAREATAREATARVFETRIGRLLVGATYVAVALLVIGVLLMIANGISPLADAPTFEPGAIVTGLTTLQPTAYLWLGLAVVIATPISRVLVALVGYATTGDRLMVAVSIAILIVITVGVVTAVTEGG
jgi:uncharacterized membrane protein